MRSQAKAEELQRTLEKKNQNWLKIEELAESNPLYPKVRVLGPIVVALPHDSVWAPLLTRCFYLQVKHALKPKASLAYAMRAAQHKVRTRWRMCVLRSDNLPLEEGAARHAAPAVAAKFGCRDCWSGGHHAI